MLDDGEILANIVMLMALGFAFCVTVRLVRWILKR